MKNLIIGGLIALLGLVLGIGYVVWGDNIQSVLDGKGLIADQGIEGGVAVEGPQGPAGPVGPQGPAGVASFGGFTNYDSLSLSDELQVSATTTRATTTDQYFQAPGYLRSGGVRFASIQLPINNATSSSLCSIPNPFWGATSSIMSMYVEFRSTSTKDIAYSISTTTSAFRYGSSTRSLVYDRLVPAKQIAQEYLLWTPHLQESTTTTFDLEARGKMYFDNSLSPDGSMPFLIGPTEYLTTNIATGTPGPIGYWSGSCSASFMKN